MTAPAVSCVGLVQIYRRDETDVVALSGVDLTVRSGQSVALLGPSGSGKSSLLALLAGAVRPTAGTVHVLGQDVGRLSERELLAFRSANLGIMLQNPGRNLLPLATAEENVAFAQRGRTRRDRRRSRALLLERVGLGAAAPKLVRALSGGEQQRLAVAVALANNPRLLLADEPTSQLDHRNGAAVVDLLRAANADNGTTMVVVTHDPAVGAAIGRTITIRDGRVGAEGRGGEDYAVVGRDGTLQLPPDVLTELPPGTLTRITGRPGGADLERIADAL